MKASFFCDAIRTLATIAVVAAAAALTASASTFSVSTSGSTFTITRSGDTSAAETVLYRTVPLSAFPGQHYTAKSDTLVFASGQTSTNVVVSESSSSIDAYKYQTGGRRSYRFDVTDEKGFPLASCDRSRQYGSIFSFGKLNTSVSSLVTLTSAGSFSSGMSSSKYVDVAFDPPSGYVQGSGKTLEGYVLIDDSYDYAQKPATVSTATLVDSTGATGSYLASIGCKIHATVCFTEKEKDDGYQYLQIVPGTSSASYDTGADPNGGVKDPTNSVYKVCFELADGSNAEGKAYFPHRGTGSSEFSLSTGRLWAQKYKSGYSGSGTGCVVLEPTVANITTRFDAGGDNDDTWGYKDFFVRMALCDTVAPALYGGNNTGVVVAPGTYAVGSTVYVSVPFKEIVDVTGAPTLSTTWGTLSYDAGDGSNVLTFKGRIEAKTGVTLKVNSLSGTVKDLAGNSISSTLSINKTFSSCVSQIPWSGSGTPDAPYLIRSTGQLDALAILVDKGEQYSNTHFSLDADLAYPHTTAWDDASSTENNYTPVGGYSKSFLGHFHGNGHVVSGIRIYKTGNTLDQGDSFLGLFGFPSGGTIRDVIVADANISGYANCGAISGYNSATLTNCLALNVRVAGRSSYAGAVAGRHDTDANKLQSNHYRDCTVNGGSINVGVNTNDVAGARSVHALALADGISVASAESVQITNVTYYAANTPVTLACTPPAGYMLLTYALNGTPFAGNTFTMPADDNSSVTATWRVAFEGSGTPNDPYRIATTNDLNTLAASVNGGVTNYAGAYFLQTADLVYDSTTNNYTPVGGLGDNSFHGTYDGGGHVVSGINVYRTGDSFAGSFVGLFGRVMDGTVRNVTLADSSFVGYFAVGGIVGYLDYMNVAIVSNCCVASSVVIGTGPEGNVAHGGIVGLNNCGTIVGCLSAASVTTNSNVYCNAFGGIVGTLTGSVTVKDCLYVGDTVEANGQKGAIVGCNEFDSDSFVNNYYTSASAPGGVCGSDVDGARRGYTLTLGNGIALVGEETVYSNSCLTAIGTSALRYTDGVTTNLYSGAGQVLTLAGGTDGYIVTKDDDGTDVTATVLNGDTLTMPGYDITVVPCVISRWEILQSQLNAGGVVTLTNDVTATANDTTLIVTNAVTLDLAGHTIDAKGLFGAITIASGGHLMLTNSVPTSGAITGGNANHGGGVLVQLGGMFTMAGGAIAGNCAEDGGGVYVYDDGTFTVSGSPVVSGNANSTGTANNVRLHNNRTIAVSNLTAGAFLGVTTQTAPTAGSPVVFADGAAAGDGAYFFSDNPAYSVGTAANGQVCLTYGTVYPAYLDGSDEFVKTNWVNWATHYGANTNAEYESHFLLDLPPWTVVPEGAALLKIVEMGVTNIPTAMSDLGYIAMAMGYTGEELPCRRLVLASDVAELRRREDFDTAFEACNGYLVLRIGTDLTLPLDEWLAFSWIIGFNDGRGEIVFPELFMEGIRANFERTAGKPVNGLFLRPCISPVPHLEWLNELGTLVEGP